MCARRPSPSAAAARLLAAAALAGDLLGAAAAPGRPSPALRGGGGARSLAEPAPTPAPAPEAAPAPPAPGPAPGPPAPTPDPCPAPQRQIPAPAPEPAPTPAPGAPPAPPAPWTTAASGRCGTEHVLFGYDVYLGNPAPTNGWLDPGFRHQIFDARYSGHRESCKTLDGQGEPPDGVTVLRCTSSCSKQAEVKWISGTKSYSKLLSASVRFDVSFLCENVASFGASFDYQRIEEGFSEKGLYYVHAEAQCCAYRAEVDYFSPPPLTEDFVEAVELAPMEYDSDYYLKIVKEFGTHYVVSADMGGVYGQQTEFKRENYADMVSLSIDWSAYAQANLLLSIKSCAGSDLEKNQSKTFESWSSSSRVYSLGSRPPASGRLEDWGSDDFDSPAPIYTELEPISSLFSEQFFTGVNVSALHVKKANVERALKEYCPQYLLPEGLISSCRAPSNDPELQAQNVTCLGKTDVIGGPGGKPFDDGAVSILNGLGGVSELEVSKVEYMAGSYVQSLQLELRKGDQSWFLPQHGKFGDADVWEVDQCEVHQSAMDQDTKITAVQVRWCAYVNSLTFYTSEGDEREIGRPGGCNTTMVNFQDEADRQFNITTSRAWLVGLLGRSDKWIDGVGFYFAYLAPPGEGCHGGIEVPRPS